MRFLKLSLPLLLALVSCAAVQSSSAPLASGQVWDVRGVSGSTSVMVKVDVPAVSNPNPGIYASSDALGILAALTGVGAPVVSLNLNEGTMKFFLRQGAGYYLCRISNVDSKATAFKGDLYVRDDVVGSCTATVQ